MSKEVLNKLFRLKQKICTRRSWKNYEEFNQLIIFTLCYDYWTIIIGITVGRDYFNND